MKFMLYSIMLLLLSPCNASKQTAQTANASADMKTVAFTLQRTACFGKCPVFELSLSGETHKAIYKGTQNTEKIGTYERTVTDDELSKLVKAFDDAHFFELQDEYNKPQVMDVPSTYISYSNKGKTKKIKDRWQSPNTLKDLEKLLDNVANSGDWTKVGE